MITAQVQVFTISGTVAQWYFARDQFATGVAILRSLGYLPFKHCKSTVAILCNICVDDAISL
jgi:hypothetical protein